MPVFSSIERTTALSQGRTKARYRPFSSIERHHPGIDTLRLPAEVAAGWKQRLRTKHTTTRSDTGETVKVVVERLGYLEILASVRAFYLDLAPWALEDPGRWGCWVAPSPIGHDELSRRKAIRRRKARMDARTRERLPILPVLVRSIDQWRTDSHATLAAGREAPPGHSYTVPGFRGRPTGNSALGAGGW